MHIRPSRKFLALAASATIGLLAFAIPATPAYAGSPTIAVTPTTGASGATVSVSGTGWAAFDSLRISLVEGTSTTFMCFLDADSTGTVHSQTCTVPTSVTQGAYTLTAADSTLSASTPFTVNPGITVLGFDSDSAVRVASGQTVGLTGSGFTASSTLKATFNGTAAALSPVVTTTADGQFSGTGFVIPTATTAGTYPVKVTDGSGKSATVHLQVYKATLTATPAAGVSGATVGLSGTGWPANDISMRVELNVGTAQNFVCFTSTDGNGNLGASCTVPTGLIQGSYNLVVEDNSLAVTVPFTLNPGITALGFGGSPVINAAAGQTVGLTGSGFAANSALKATFKAKAIALTFATSTTTDGAFTGTGIVIPAATKTGIYPITVTDASSNTATIDVSIYKATLKAAPATGVSGATVNLSGTGWPSNDISMRVELNVGTAQNFVCFTSTDGNGNLAASCTLPTGLIQGKYNLVVEDNSLAVSIPYTLNPGITVLGFGGSPVINAAAGQTVGLTGSGFAANATLKATFNGTSVPLTAAVSTTTDGQFSGTGIVIPATTAAGDYPVTVKDSSGHIGTVMVNVYAATLTVTPTTGISGQTFEVNGTGWPSNDISMRVELTVGTSQTFACFASTDGNGNLAQSCTVPTGLIQGPYTLVVEDNSLAVSTPITVDPGISLFAASNGAVLTSAAPGTAATVSGSGFAPNSTIVKLTIGSKVVSFTAAPVTGASGSFSGGAFTIPSSMAAGTYTVTVTDSSSNSGTAQLTVT
jgi:5-hydroxyisourate hydrolase-like protein (transthyretin family)